MDEVELEANVVFQITRHLNDQFPACAGGVLLGMQDEKTVQVTESFPLQVNALEGDGSNLRSKETQAYQTNVIEKLKVVKSDSSVQGWYLSSNLGSIYQQPILDNMFAYQSENPNAVMLVHDVALGRNTGSLSLRAFRLSPQYLRIRLEAQSRFNSDTLERYDLSYNNILTELSVYLHNSHLVNLLTVSKCGPKLNNDDFKELQVPKQELVETGIDDVVDSIDDFIYDQGNYNYYHRHLTREKQKVQQWQQKRKAENAQRREQGKQPLSLDEWKLLFKMPDEPSRLENLLVSAQLDQYCTQIDEIGAIARSNMF